MIVFDRPSALLTLSMVVPPLMTSTPAPIWFVEPPGTFMPPCVPPRAAVAGSPGPMLPP